jgi:flagellar motor component MotA
MMTDVALDTDQAKTIGIVVIVGLVVIGAVLSLIISAIVGRLLTIVVVVGLAVLVWSQRADISSAAKKCDATFFGVHLTPSNPDVKARCQNLSK